MSEQKKSDAIELGVYAQDNRASGLEPADIVALALSLVWLAATGAFFYFAGGDGEGVDFDPLTFLMTFLAVAMPVALFWVGASAAKSARIMREESTRLQSAIDAMRHSYIEQQQNHGLTVRPAMERKLDQIAASQKQAEHAIATFATTRTAVAEAAPTALPAPAAAQGGDDQPALALGTPAEELEPPLATSDFIRALNFPETPEDRDGFRALRLALQHRSSAKLIRASQDVLTLLSQDGIYMDDLSPDRARTEIWRKFAAGERGPTISALGGVRDRSCLALSAGRMRQDPVFRDAAHHFLRQFDRSLSAFAETATDEDLSKLSDTRTARAFMLLGRVSGTFD